MSERLSSSQLAEASGSTFRQIDYWVRQGYLKPDDAAHPGSGGARRYGAREVDVAVFLRAMSDAEMLGQAGNRARRFDIDKLVRKVRTHGLVGQFIIHDGFIVIDLDVLARETYR